MFHHNTSVVKYSASAEDIIAMMWLNWKVVHVLRKILKKVCLLWDLNYSKLCVVLYSPCLMMFTAYA